MNKEQFWRIVDDVRSSADPKNQRTVLFALQEQLRKLPSAEIMEWQEIFQFYDDAAYRDELWAASGAMGAHCSDDGFMDFRSWLISQGRDVYMAALRDPESLAEVDTEGQSLNFEQYAYVAPKAYAQRRAYEAGPLTEVIQEYINWASQYERQVLDHLMEASPHEKNLSAGVANAFLRGCLERKYDLYDDAQRITPNPELLDSLMEDIPEKRDFDPNWTLEDLPRIFPRLCQKYEAQMVTWTAKGPLPAKAVERNSPPRANCQELDAVRRRVGTLTADEETILTAIVLRYDPESAEQAMELLDHVSDYTILKGVNCYESLGRYYLAHDTSVPEELYEYMNLDALGCRYEDEHPGVFVGNDYVQYPPQTQTMSLKMK
ncbi:MAG: DUF4240 domain-containing protein [Clostridiales bacterium]|nr:DUF4240 domain-containing protein [Clostridiales bacterium]